MDQIFASWLRQQQVDWDAFAPQTDLVSVTPYSGPPDIPGPPPALEYSSSSDRLLHVADMPLCSSSCSHPHGPPATRRPPCPLTDPLRSRLRDPCTGRDHVLSSY